MHAHSSAFNAYQTAIRPPSHMHKHRLMQVLREKPIAKSPDRQRARGSANSLASEKNGRAAVCGDSDDEMIKIAIVLDAATL
ncbi:unnamed protein product [Heligmosomoides polygyrus]|uniref:Uncharacterized protein n=1 Tax=Heligmosomoides polygyrus TaxID=6339 RepID=A0A183GPN5_HELPZ|nr:unnamed protein product [Heligmosomoides polygyrus]